MSEFKGTKEDWIKDRAIIKIGVVTYTPECNVEDFDNNEHFKRVTEVEAEANALLIIKAQQMLEMLQSVSKIKTTLDLIQYKLKAEQLIKEATEL